MTRSAHCLSCAASCQHAREADGAEFRWRMFPYLLTFVLKILWTSFVRGQRHLAVAKAEGQAQAACLVQLGTVLP